jgi:hypothetical protein
VKRPLARLLAWGTGVPTLALIACFVVMTLLNGSDIFDVNFAIVGISSTVVGGVVTSRRPANPVGWLFLGSALSAAIKVLAREYAVYRIVTSPMPCPYLVPRHSSPTRLFWSGRRSASS